MKKLFVLLAILIAVVIVVDSKPNKPIEPLDPQTLAAIEGLKRRNFSAAALMRKHEADCKEILEGYKALTFDSTCIDNLQQSYEKATATLERVKELFPSLPSQDRKTFQAYLRQKNKEEGVKIKKVCPWWFRGVMWWKGVTP